jgi:hypothetical protein
MSSFTCPDCADGALEAKVREVDLELADGETAQIVGGVVLVTSVGCNNGCDSHEEKPKREKKEKDEASLSSAPDRTGHDTKLAERVEG